MAEDTPAAVSFDHAQGRIGSTGEGAAAAVRTVLNTPDLGHAWITAGAGVVGFAFAPIAAGYGALSSAHQRLPGDKLAETESELAEAMRALAGQEYLRELLMQATNEIQRPLVVLEPKTSALPDGAGVCARLEARVEQFRLERVDRRDRFALRITARIRLVGAADGRLIYERLYEYSSDKAMFVDWAPRSGIEGVARTGYRDLAERIAKDVANCSGEAPMLLGAGHSRRSGPKLGINPVVTPEPGEQQTALVSFIRRPAANSRAAVPARFHRLGLSSPETTQFADFQPDDLSFEIQSTARTGFRLQLPQTRAQATVEAQSDTEWALDGLENDRNFVVQAGAKLAAIPLGIWEQSAAIWRGLSHRRLAAAKDRLGAVTNYARPQEAIALEVARNLSPRSMERILPAVAVTPSPTRSITTLSRCSFGTTATEGRSDTVLEIRVLRASLSGKEGINPHLALNVEARARVLRAADGVEIFSIPAFYRSREKRFCAWASHDARAFRQELDCCYREMGQAVAGELASRGLAPSSRTSVLASN
ncbi:MAG TPA: hypothetical protein VJA21_11180 [Verrucomicrobiae bacterium]